MKNAHVRVQDTIQFIQSQRPPAVSPAAFAGLTAALAVWSTNAPQPARQQLSLLMSQNGTTNRPPSSQDRKYRRAMILLKCAIVDPNGNWAQLAQGVNNQAINGLAVQYGWAMEAARDAAFSTAPLVTNELNQLLTQTRRFMNSYKLVVNGQPNGGLIQYGFYMQQGAYYLDCFQAQHGAQVQAINIPAQPYAGIVNTLGQIQATLADIAQGHTLALTTQFTGCCYCFERQGTNLAAAHIDPQGRATGVTGQQIQQALQGGGFANTIGGPFRAYGRVNGNQFGYPQAAQQMIVVAVARNNRWRVYAQIDLGNNNIQVERLAP